MHPPGQGLYVHLPGQGQVKCRLVLLPPDKGGWGGWECRLNGFNPPNPPGQGLYVHLPGQGQGKCRLVLLPPDKGGWGGWEPLECRKNCGNYRPGAGKRIRTPDIFITNEALYLAELFRHDAPQK